MRVCQAGTVITLLFFCITARLSSQSFVLNGSATSQGGGCYQLTSDAPGQSGNIFSQNTIDLTQPFSLDARLFFGCKDVNGADGMVFIFATTNTALGVGGGGLGYQGITPSIGIEYDDYFNSEFGDPTSDHMAVISMGDVNHNTANTLAGPEAINNIEDCMEHCFEVTWDPVSMRLTAILDDYQIGISADIVNTIFGGNPNVYYGFSSGTGGLSNIHRVCFGPPPVLAMPDASICEGQSTVLGADPNGIAWTWAPDPTLSSLTIRNPVANPTVTTTYTTTIEYPCGYFGYDTVVVAVLPLPMANASNDSPVCIGQTLSLFANGGVSYQWSGPSGFSSSAQNPVRHNVTAGMAGTYVVTVSDGNGCTNTASTLVEVDPGPVITFDPAPDPICQDLNPFQLTADPPGGVWSGDISPSGIFNPNSAGQGTHILTYTATNANGCTNSAQLQIEVHPLPDVFIDPPGSLCVDSPPIQVLATPAGGDWSGEISAGGLFDPGSAGEGSHLITYTVVDGFGCSSSASVVVVVEAGQPADISPVGPFCRTDDVITLTGIPAGGDWGGAADPLGRLFPNILGPGTHTVTYTVINQNGCFYGQLDIEVQDVPVVTISPAGPYCSNEPVQTLSASPPGGVWSGVADPAGQFQPSVLGSGTHLAIYTVTTSAGCADADTFQVVIYPPAPVVLNVNTFCDATAETFVVTFAITGGDPMTYIVTGTPAGTIAPGSPSVFTSSPIPSGSAYSFVIQDANGCDSVLVAGSHTCDCETNAGMMIGDILLACEGSTITFPVTAGAVLDPDDTLVYVLHLGFPNNILLVSATNAFTFGPPLETGVLYFVHAVAGNALPGSGVDLTDPCLSLSFGSPTLGWLENPAGYMTGPSAICEGDSADITFELEGIGPFDVIYGEGSNSVSLSNIFTGHTITVWPDTTTSYVLQQVTDLSTPGCFSMPDTGITIEVLANALINRNVQICPGDSILLGGSMQFVAGVYTDTLQTSSGCDSLVSTTLMLYPSDTLHLSDVSCDPGQTGVFTEVLTDINGCDSTVITTVTFVDSYITLMESMTCDVDQAGIDSISYIAQSGCDSLVITTVIFVSSDTVQLSGATCDPSAAGTFVQMLINTGGCDSLVIEVISLLPSDSLVLQETTCLPQETGSVLTTFMNEYGCDSLVWTVTVLAPYDSCHVPVLPTDVFIPNVFSPNGDGSNDRFVVFAHPDALARIPAVRIFDRWGGLVFEIFDLQPNDDQYGWDGVVRGQPAGPGVFVYIVELEYADGRPGVLVGNVTLVR